MDRTNDNNIILNSKVLRYFFNTVVLMEKLALVYAQDIKKKTFTNVSIQNYNLYICVK